MSAEATVGKQTGARRGEGQPLLEVRSIEVTYEKVELAIRGINVEVPKGEITAVLGANGAGKTTMLRAIGGFLPGEHAEVTDGQILFKGTRIDGMQPHKVAALGIAMVPERDKIFATMTVEENLRVSVSRGDAGREDLHTSILDMFPVLKKRSGDIAGYLSGGERQMLAIASTLLCDPELILVDELSLGLAPKLVNELFAKVEQIAREYGLTVLMVEQDASAALAIADYAYVMEGGRVVLDGTPERLMEHEDIKEFYLGLAEGSGDARSFAQVKQYTRSRRWWG